MTEMFFTVDGKEYCNKEAALSKLLADDILFVNENAGTVALYVLANDLFWWATGDGLELPEDEIGTLYKMHMAEPNWGSVKWCCRQRKLRPQIPIVEKMKADGAWDAEMEALPAPNPS